MKVNLSSFFLFLLIIKKWIRSEQLEDLFLGNISSSVWPLSFFFVLLLYVYWIRFFLYVVFCFGRHHSHMFQGTFLSHFICFVFSWLLWSFKSSYTYLFLREFLTYVVFIEKMAFSYKKRLFLHTIGAISAYTIVAVDFSRNYSYIQMMFRAFFLVGTLT